MRRFAMIAAVLALSGSGLLAQSPQQITLPPGTRIKTELRTGLDTAQVKAGMKVEAVVRSDVKVHGKKLLPKGSRLIGSILAVTPAESPKSPSHIAVVFTQARTKSGEGVVLNAAIVAVQRVAPPQRAVAPPMLPRTQQPEADPQDSDGKQTATLGTMAMPSQMTDPNQTLNAIVVRSRLAPISIRVVGDQGSVLTSRGDIQLRAGTRLELQQLPVGGAAGGGNQ